MCCAIMLSLVSVFVTAWILLLKGQETYSFAPRQNSAKSTLHPRYNKCLKIKNPKQNCNPLNTCQTFLANSRGGAVSPSSSLEKKKFSVVRLLTSTTAKVATAAVIGCFAFLELREQLQENRIKRAHGIVTLAFLKGCRAFDTFESEFAEVEEELEEVLDDRQRKQTKSEPKENEAEGPQVFLERITGLFSSRFISLPLCIFAFMASLSDIVKDVAPGAHHGAALLALSECYRYVLRVFKRPRGKLARIMGPVIFLAAASMALMEVLEDVWRPVGAHHGVVLLSFAEFMENVQLSKMATTTAL